MKNKTIIQNSNTEIKMSLNQYLLNYSVNRRQDNVIRKWYIQKDPKNSKKTKTEWDSILKSFFGVNR